MVPADRYNQAGQVTHGRLLVLTVILPDLGKEIKGNKSRHLLAVRLNIFKLF